MLRYVGVEVGWVDRGQAQVHAEFLLEILLGKGPVGRQRRRGILKMTVRFGGGWNWLGIRQIEDFLNKYARTS